MAVNVLAPAVPLVTAMLTLCGIGYSLLALWGTRSFRRASAARHGTERPGTEPPGVSILKPLRGVDPRMYAGLVSHCNQRYKGPYEIVFGVGSLEDAAVAEVARLRVEYPGTPIHLVECVERLGPNGKVSSLAQMLPQARYEHVVVNDSDILVGPDYLQHIVAPFFAQTDAPGAGVLHARPVGLVTVPYFGRAGGTLFSRLEALGIATDFLPGVLAARAIEGGLRFGLGSTLATTKSALASIGGFESLVDQLADDYELGARLFRTGYRVEMVDEIVATSIAAYDLRGFANHQLRWSRSTRDSRRAGYFGLAVTYTLPWALATVLASGFAFWSFSLLSVALLVRLTVALTVGVGLLRDDQVLRDLLWVPVRDLFGLFFWAWSYASDAIVWRGERFRLNRGRLERM